MKVWLERLPSADPKVMGLLFEKVDGVFQACKRGERERGMDVRSNELSGRNRGHGRQLKRATGLRTSLVTPRNPSDQH